MAVNRLTLTQVDPTVLAELPEELQKEIVAGLPPSHNTFAHRGNLHPDGSDQQTHAVLRLEPSPRKPSDDRPQGSQSSTGFANAGASCAWAEGDSHRGYDEDPRQVWQAVRTTLEGLAQRLNQAAEEEGAPSNRDTADSHSREVCSPEVDGQDEAAGTDVAMHTHFFQREDVDDHCDRRTENQSPGCGMTDGVAGMLPSAALEDGEAQPQPLQEVGHSGSGDREASLNTADEKLAALCTLLKAWGESLIDNNLEGLQFLLRRLVEAQSLFPLLASPLASCFTALQARVEERLGGPVQL